MADTPQTLALIVTAQEYGGDIVRQINRTSQTLRMIPIMVGEGQNVAWAAEGDGQLAEEYAEGADASNFGSDAQNDAILTWSQMRSNFRVTGLARATSRTSRTPAGNVGLWARNLVNSSAKLANHVNQRIFNGSGAGSPKQITGLDVAAGDDTNVYATIDRTVDAYWQPTVVDPGSLTPITLQQIRDDLRQVYEASGEMPTLGPCSPAVFNQIVGLFDSTRRYMQRVDEVQTARGVVKLDASYRGVEVDGCVFYRDKDATANEIFYLNDNYIYLEVLPQEDLVDMMPGLTPGMMLSANDGFGALPLLFQYEMLATTGDSKKAEVRLYAELCVKKPNAFGVRKNVQA
jgi:hypothetical protein